MEERRKFKTYGVIDLLLGEYVLSETSDDRRQEIDQTLRGMNVSTQQQLRTHGYELPQNQVTQVEQKGSE